MLKVGSPLEFKEPADRLGDFEWAHSRNEPSGSFLE